MISVIVPVYNVEQYISKCIESVITQTYIDWELILVDDGSSDESLTICKRYATQDNRIIVIHQENQGVSSARNKGIEIARGEYITFIDSDDYVSPTYLSDMVKYDTDIIASGFTLWYASDNRSETKTFKQLNSYSNTNGDIAEAIEIGEMNHLWKGPCTKLFRKSLINEHNIRFDESISYGEDHLFVMSLIKYCDSIILLPVSNYIYTHYGNISLTNRQVPYQDMFRYIANIDNLRQEIIKLRDIKSSSYLQFCDNELRVHFWRGFYSLYCTQNIRKQRLKAIKQVKNIIRKNAFEIRLNTVPTYKAMNIIYQIFPFALSDVMNRTIAISKVIIYH